MIEVPTGGELYYQGQDLLKHDPQAQKLRRQKIQIVFQNPYGSLNPRKKVGQILEEPLLINSNLSKEQRREKALAMMAKVGLKTEHYDRYPHMFSGGQRQRIAIARGLMLDPDVVIADEPVSALDVSVRAQVLNLMMDLQQELGLSYVFISHDLSVVEHIADEVMVMYLGRCVEKGTKDQIFNNPRHPYTQALLSATPRLNPDDRRERIKLTGELPSPLNPPPGCAFNARCSRRFGPCTQLQPQLKEYGGSWWPASRSIRMKMARSHTHNEKTGAKPVFLCLLDYFRRRIWSTACFSLLVRIRLARSRVGRMFSLRFT